MVDDHSGAMLPISISLKAAYRSVPCLAMFFFGMGQGFSDRSCISTEPATHCGFVCCHADLYGTRLASRKDGLGSVGNTKNSNALRFCDGNQGCFACLIRGVGKATVCVNEDVAGFGVFKCRGGRSDNLADGKMTAVPRQIAKADAACALGLCRTDGPLQHAPGLKRRMPLV